MGTIAMDAKAVADVVAYAAEKCDGFAKMSEKSKSAEAARKVSGNATGVRICKTKDGIKLDVYIACTHGADVKALRQNVEKSVKSAFSRIDVKINDVVVHINDVR